MPILLSKSTDHERGAALLEVLVAIAIAGLALGLLGVGVPAFREQRQLDDHAWKIEQFLLSARREAMRRQHPVEIQMEARQWTSLPDRKRLDLGGFLGKLEVVAAAELRIGRTDRLVFLPDGRTSGAKIRLADTRQMVLLEVHWSTGNVRRERR